MWPMNLFRFRANEEEEEDIELSEEELARIDEDMNDAPRELYYRDEQAPQGGTGEVELDNTYPDTADNYRSDSIEMLNTKVDSLEISVAEIHCQLMRLVELLDKCGIGVPNESL